MSRIEVIESAAILAALASLWPLIAGHRSNWYRVWLLAVLVGMVWLAVRRIRRVAAAARHAERRRDEAERRGRPPFLG